MKHYQSDSTGCTSSSFQRLANEGYQATRMRPACLLWVERCQKVTTRGDAVSTQIYLFNRILTRRLVYSVYAQAIFFWLAVETNSHRSTVLILASKSFFHCSGSVLLFRLSSRSEWSGLCAGLGHEPLRLFTPTFHESVVFAHLPRGLTTKAFASRGRRGATGNIHPVHVRFELIDPRGSISEAPHSASYSSVQWAGLGCVS